jgi:hypothetical protein
MLDFSLEIKKISCISGYRGYFRKRRTKYTSGHILTKREGGADEQEL